MQKLTVTPSLYDRDYLLWINRTVADLRAGNFRDLDLANLIEEIEDMGRSQKQAWLSSLKIVLMHLLKYAFQPEKRSNSWRSTLREHRDRLQSAIEDSPSLRPYAIENLEICYTKALKLAADETGLPRSAFPPCNPFSLDEIFDSEYLPD
jgi:hypothetical protein